MLSRKMLMAWKNLRLKSCASITPKILELNAALEGSTTFMALLALGKVDLSNAYLVSRELDHFF